MKSMLKACAALLFCLGPCVAAHAAEAGNLARENQLKAAYLFNFLKFVEWPERFARSELRVCVRGAEGVREALAAAIENKRIGALPVTVRSLPDDARAEECSALYVGADAQHDGSQLAVEEMRLPLLTISDASGFTRHGGIIELLTEQNRLRFRINISNAHRVGLRVSAGLLQLAAAVENNESK